MDPIPNVDRPKPTPNGTATGKTKTHTHSHSHSRSRSQAAEYYRECLKNHAASLGAHALDGCGEFMPSPSSNPGDPSSLTCAACGCHRNFHRRLHFLNFHHGHILHNPEELDVDHHHLHQGSIIKAEEGVNDGYAAKNNNNSSSQEEVEDEEEEEGEGEGEGEGEREEKFNQHQDDRAQSTSPPPPSATHMLLALSMPQQQQQQQQQRREEEVSGAGPTRKRARSKFTQEQKEKMLELSELLGWRMQRRHDSILEERCRDIGISKGVFKVWMHNHKHNSSPSSSSKRPPAPLPISAVPAPFGEINHSTTITDNGTTASVEYVRVTLNGSATTTTTTTHSSTS